MRTARILLLLAAGVLWVLLAPENVILRYVSLIAVMSVVYTFTALVFDAKPALAASKRERG